MGSQADQRRGRGRFSTPPHPRRCRPRKAQLRAAETGVCPETCLSQRTAPPGFLRWGQNYPFCNACKITVYFIFLKTPVINVRYRWSALKCQSQYTTLLLAGSSLAVTGDRAPGAGGQAPSSARSRGPRPRRPSPGARRPLRGRSRERALPEPGGRSGGRAAEADTRITLLQAPGGGHGAKVVGGGGAGSCEHAELLFLSPFSLQSELQAYMVKEKNNKENV